MTSLPDLFAALGMQPFEWQALAMQDEARLQRLTNPRRSGTSTFGVLKLIAAATSHPNRLVGLVVPGRPRANQRFVGLAELLVRASIAADSDRSGLFFRFDNGSKLLVLGIESTPAEYGPCEVRGLSFDALVLDHEGQLDWLLPSDTDPGMVPSVFVKQGWLLELKTTEERP